ncbi:MAG: hypothetical protein IJ017_01295 [Oscillospiraceae bacterium]|nr:hypothetical protein [Oscillospiraceae bacterium]
MAMKLELNQETIDYIEDLKNDLRKLSQDLDEDKKALKASFDSHSEGLGVHTEIFEEWVNSTMSSVKDNGENVIDDVIGSLNKLQAKISDYI